MSSTTNQAPSTDNGRAQGRRDQILSAAATLFPERGFHGTSMSELAKGSQMSVGHIYHYYENKDAIIEALVEREMEHMPGVVAEVSGADADPTSPRLEDTVGPHLDRRRSALSLEMLAEAARNPRIADKIHTHDAVAREQLTAAVRERLPHLADRDVADRVEAISASFRGLLSDAIHNPDLNQDSIARITRLVIRAILTTSD